MACTLNEEDFETLERLPPSIGNNAATISTSLKSRDKGSHLLQEPEPDTLVVLPPQNGRGSRPSCVRCKEALALVSCSLPTDLNGNLSWHCSFSLTRKSSLLGLA